MSDPHDSDKLGPIEDHPPGSPFNDRPPLARRMPGWHPDTQNNRLKTLYPEEMLLRDKYSKFQPFQPPFKEPPPFPDKKPTNQTEWDAFYETTLEWRAHYSSWLLGVSSPKNPAVLFDKFLAEVGTRARRYNAALYWLRRLHFHAHAEPVKDPPAYNEYGDREKNLPPKNSQDFRDLVQAAKKEWRDAVTFLNVLLDGQTTDDPNTGENPNHGYFATKADMIEVNGYIVSMRIVAAEDPWPADGQVRTEQIGGSESSHIYLSSAFSSYGGGGLALQTSPTQQRRATQSGEAKSRK